MGTCINTGLVTGIWITNFFNLSLPYWGEGEEAPPEAADTILWRISYSLQLFPVAITTICWLFIFRTEPLKFLIAKAEREGKDSQAYEEARRSLCHNYGLKFGEPEEKEAYNNVKIRI